MGKSGSSVEFRNRIGSGFEVKLLLYHANASAQTIYVERSMTHVDWVESV
jgi:hypothetical protein